MGRWAGRTAAAMLGLVAGALLLAGIAAAHVEVSADPAEEGATNAVVTFSAEAESPSAGIASVQIVLPDGLTSNDVSLNKAPDGWKLTADATGYTVAGPPLAQGVDAVHSIVVTHLPAMPALTFKALVTYSNGDIDRWIDEKTAANPNPDHPAAVLELSGPGATPTTTDASSSAPATAPPSPTAAPATTGGGLGWLWWVVAAVVVALIVVVVVLLRRRGRGAPTP